MAMAWRYRGSRTPTKGVGIAGMVLGAFFFVGGVVLAGVFWLDKGDMEHLRDAGQSLPGEVIAHRHEVKKSRKSTNHYYYITVRYDHPLQKQFLKEVQIKEDSYRQFAAANTLNPLGCTVLADPADANHFVIKEAVGEQISGKGTSVWMALLIGCGFGLVCSLAGYSTFRKASAQAGGYNPFAQPAYVPPGGYPPQGHPPQYGYAQSPPPSYPPQPHVYRPPPPPPMPR
jgi:hypothetical protein